MLQQSKGNIGNNNSNIEGTCYMYRYLMEEVLLYGKKNSLFVDFNFYVFIIYFNDLKVILGRIIIIIIAILKELATCIVI